MSHGDNLMKLRKGFTLIELMLAMTFISILLIAIAMTIIQISNIYNHGMTLKEVNQAGRALSEDIQRTIKSSSQFDITGTNNAYIQQGDWGGRLCMGSYSYIWNYGQALNNNDPKGESLNVYSDNSDTKIRFIKVIDSDSSYCTDPTKKIDASSSVDLLDAGDHSLVLHQFTITSSDSAYDGKTAQRLYTVRFTVGTNDINALVADKSKCKAPNEVGSDPSYCSVQEFSIVARAGNAVE
jgi:type II secretory pathway pseudopilin PulG